MLREMTRLPFMRRWGWGVLVIFLVVAFQVMNIPNVHMHPDEELSYRATRGTLTDTLHYQMSFQDNQAPLWFVTFWAWQQGVGDAEYTSRIMGILMSVCTLAITYRLGRRWFGIPAALAAIAVLGANHFFFTYSLDIRMYPLALLSAALSMWTFDRWRLHPTRRKTIAYGLTIALMLYVHYLLVFLIAGQMLFILWFQRLKRRLVLAGIGALALGFVVWLPWFPAFVSQVIGLKNVEAASGTGRGVAGIGVSTQVTSLYTIGQLLNTATNGLPWLYGLVLAFGLVTLWRRTGFRLALVWGLGVPTIALLANLVAAVYAPRFISHTVIGLALAIGAALLIKRTRLRLSAAAVFVAVNLLLFPTQFPLRVPYRDLYTQVSALARAGDVLLQKLGGEGDGFVDWQIGHYLPDSLTATLTHDSVQAASARRIWLMTGDLFSEQVKADFDSLEPTHPVQTVIGDCDRGWCYVIQLMEAPPWAEAQAFSDFESGAGLPFWGADIDRITATGIETRLWWRVEESPSLDYSMGLHLISADGGLAAQSDGPIQHYGAETVPTSTMQPEDIYIDFRTLPLPPNLSPGVYELALVVYRPWDGVRLTLPDGTDHLVLDTISIP
jgi:hypothetical protein